MPILFQSKSTKFPIEIESIGTNWEQDDVNRPNGHPYFHWLQTEGGSGKLIINDKQYILKQNQGILISPFTPHQYTSSNQPWRTNFLTFRGSMSTLIHQMIDYQPYVFADESTQFSFKNWIYEMMKNIQETKTPDIHRSTNCYYFLLQVIQQQKTTKTSPVVKKYIQPSLAYIHTHLSEDLRVQILAEQVFVTPQYLSRLFQKYISMSPYQYILEERIHAAKELLLNQPNIPIQLIAHQVGFESASQFSMIFKKKTNYTPKEFRQLY